LGKHQRRITRGHPIKLAWRVRYFHRADTATVEVVVVETTLERSINKKTQQRSGHRESSRAEPELMV
jgi:hypothetical protein